MGKGKSRKKRGNGKTCYIPKTEAMSWEQFVNQSGNMKQAKKISEKQNQIKGNINKNK